MFELDAASVAVGAIIPLVLFAVPKLCRPILHNAVGFDIAQRGYKVVITGGSRGLGLALARRFLSLGDDVYLVSRTAASAHLDLGAEFPGRQVLHRACDVANRQQVDGVAKDAVEKMGRVDIWINNAALSQEPKCALWESRDYGAIVSTNLTGAMNGCAAAVHAMTQLQTPPGGKIFLVDGTGAWGNATPQNAAYGATKRGLTQLKDTLVKELKGTPVHAHMFSPGMVATNLLVQPNLADARAMRFINALAEDPAVVAAWLVPRIRAVKRPGAYFKFLTVYGAMWRLFSGLVLGARKGRFDGYKKHA